LKLKNPNLKSIGIDISDKGLTEDIKQYINLHIGTSEDFKGQKYDFVFIDADHSYEGVSTDYENLGKYAKIVMFHDINDSTCPGVVKFWNEIKEGKKYKEFTYQTNNNQIQGIGILFNEDDEDDVNVENDEYPLARHLSSYESAISILEKGFLMSRNELKKETQFIDENDTWWNERKEIELEKFGTEDLIFCIPDWFNDGGYETGHGSVMIYFKPTMYEKFKVTFTLLDSVAEDVDTIYKKKELKKIYSNLTKEKFYPEYKYESKTILKNLNHKNDGRVFETSKGKVFIEGDRFYNLYSEIQIHTNKIPIEYIKEIRLTDNYLKVSESDQENKEKLISLCKKQKINIIVNF
jgi:hypothetical protein